MKTTMVTLKEHDNGGHGNNTSDYKMSLPEGWAVFPDGPDVENFPFFHIDATEVIDGKLTVTAWHPLPKPEPEPEPEPEPTETELLQMAVAELAEAMDEQNTQNQLAIAELAEAMMGGETDG